MSSPSKSKVSFFFLAPVSLRDRNMLKECLVRIFKKEQHQLESLNYIFCSDPYLLTINQQYLHHDDLTDIISFELSGKNEPVIGEIYISIDRVRENANLHQQSLKRELHRVIFHGALHLCGYKDKKPADQKLMRTKEEEYLELYGL